ncbi:hypothetical protein FRC12_004696 [Ceratobasidium sp. 428]|nr:hypothetical protein FRC12_004696 [Ceratobasidium sp. 428]
MDITKGDSPTRHRHFGHERGRSVLGSKDFGSVTPFNDSLPIPRPTLPAQPSRNLEWQGPRSPDALTLQAAWFASQHSDLLVGRSVVVTGGSGCAVLAPVRWNGEFESDVPDRSSLNRSFRAGRVVGALRLVTPGFCTAVPTERKRCAVSEPPSGWERRLQGSGSLHGWRTVGASSKREAETRPNEQFGFTRISHAPRVPSTTPLLPPHRPSLLPIPRPALRQPSRTLLTHLPLPLPRLITNPKTTPRCAANPVDCPSARPPRPRRIPDPSTPRRAPAGRPKPTTRRGERAPTPFLDETLPGVAHGEGNAARRAGHIISLTPAQPCPRTATRRRERQLLAL